MRCTPTVAGTKHFSLTTVQGGPAVAGAENIRVEVLESNAAIIALTREIEALNSLVAKMNLTSRFSEDLSRSDAVVLLDDFLTLIDRDFSVDVGSVGTAFLDVDPSAEYTPALKRLTHFVGAKDNVPVVTPSNAIFRPLDKVSRQEFLGMLLQGIDVALTGNSSTLSRFTDSADIVGTWADPYFATAVEMGVVAGNNGSLFPREKILVREAMLMLAASRPYAHGVTGAGAFDFSNAPLPQTVREIAIGERRLPRFNYPTEAPVAITGIRMLSASDSLDACGTDGRVLEVEYEYTAKEVLQEPYFWWTANAGGFREHPDAAAFEQVCFYGAAIAPTEGYLIDVGGGDDLGFETDHRETFPASTFDYLRDTTRDLVVVQEIGNLQTSGSLVASALFRIDLSSLRLTKSGIDLGLEAVAITLEWADGGTTPVFGESISAREVSFLAPSIPARFGQRVVLKLNISTQDKMQSIYPQPGFFMALASPSRAWCSTPTRMRHRQPTSTSTANMWTSIRTADSGTGLLPA